MRITNNMMMQRYNRHLNRNLGRMNHSSEQISTGRRFMRGSEDPVRALQALQVRRRGTALQQFNFNIESAQSWLTNTEQAIRSIKGAADQAVDLVLQGRNDTLAIEDRQIIGTALRSIQEQLLKDLNSQIAGKYMFGGANTKQTPFIMCDRTGHLWFNVHPDVIELAAEAKHNGTNSGLYIDDFAAHGLDGWNVFLMGHDGNAGFDEFLEQEESVYWDLTGAFQKNELGGTIINRTTVFDLRVTGLQIIGTGPNNLFNLIGRIALAFETDDMRSIDGPVDGSGLLEIQVDAEGNEWTKLEDFLILRYPDRSAVNPYFGAMDTFGGRIPDPNASPPYSNDLYLVRPEMPGWRPFTATTMTRYLDPDYHTAFIGGDGLFSRLRNAQLNTLLELTRVGERANHVNFLQRRNEDSTFQMQMMQNRLEAMPPEEAILNFKMHDFVYKASLQMSAQLFQPGLMHFIGR